MRLGTGDKLGPYEITAPIGAGGMGEVYRARDPRLGRDVAIKVSAERFSERFEKEARAIAAVSHSNICILHDVGPDYLVMELVEGPTLADRIQAGNLPLEETLRIARQIAEALEAAHEKGIVHRDLKPANIKIKTDGTVKVLDFGLAKTIEPGGPEADPENSPTLTLQEATRAGLILGTAGYMSPEQAKGKPVDRRADIWAFGCVLYEMLTGKKAFAGDGLTETLAAVLKGDPDWSRLPISTPSHIRVLLRQCLRKDIKQRLRDIGDARLSLDEGLPGALEGGPSVIAAKGSAPRWPLWVTAGLAAFFALGVAVLAFLYFHQKPPVAQVMRFGVPMPEGFNQTGNIALSPDGRKLAFIGTSTNRGDRLWIRSMDVLDAQALEGTDGADGFPFWSRDSRYIVFSAAGKLKKIDASGGPPVVLCDLTSVLGGAWTRDDKIIFGSAAGLLEVSAAGGSTRPITADGVSITPSLLPDGRHFVYFHPQPNRASGIGIYVGTVENKPQQQSSDKKILGDVSMVAYSASSDPDYGYLLFVRGAGDATGAAGTLMAQRFDTRRMELTGEAIAIAEHISNATFSASDTGALIYGTASRTGIGTDGSKGNVPGRLTWFDRQGKPGESIGEPGIYRTLRLSPDGKRVVFERANPQNPLNRNLWLYDFARGVTTRFTTDSGWDTYPVWYPDGSRIVFGSYRDGWFDLYQRPSNLAGGIEPLYKSHDYKVPSDWSPDGRYLLFFNPVGHANVWRLSFGSGDADRKPVQIEQSEFNQSLARFSPDGRWVAYYSDESGKGQVYVRPFNAGSTTGSSQADATRVTGKWMVSKDGGINPLWRRDGKELFYLSPDGMAMAVDVGTSRVFQPGIPKPLFKVPPGTVFWDVSADGNRFLITAPSLTSAPTAPKFTLVLNWQAGLKK